MAKIQHGPMKDIGQCREVVAQCPHCLALETVWLDGNQMWPTQRFKMQTKSLRGGPTIYHDCGTDQACKLWRAW